MFRRWILFRPDDGTGGDGGVVIDSGGAPAADGRPEWLPERFENPEALAQAYEASEREMKRLQNESKQQERQFTEAIQRIEANMAQQQQPVYNPQADPLMSAAQRAWEEGDVATFMAINAQVSQAATAQVLDERLKPLTENLGGATQADRDIAFRLAEQQVAPQFGDRWGELAPKINDIIAADPSTLPGTPSVEGYAQRLTLLAKQVDYDRLANAQAAADAERAAKLAANTLGPGPGRTPTDTDEKKQEWDRIKNAPDDGWGSLVGG